MLDVVVVTTFPAQYWHDGVAKQMLSSLADRWPAHTRKIAFVRDDLRSTIGAVAGVEIMDLDDRSSSLMKFIRTFSPAIKPLVSYGGRYEYRWDVASFAFKIAALDAARALLDKSYVGYLVWLDSDVLTTADIPSDILCQFLPEDVDCTCLVRAKYGPECGFVGYNFARRGRAFLDRLVGYYQERPNGTYPVFELKEWHDSYVFGEVLHEGRFRFLNLAAGTTEKHCWPQTPLSAFMSHLKGLERKRRKEDLPDSVILKEPDRVKEPLRPAT